MTSTRFSCRFSRRPASRAGFPSQLAIANTALRDSQRPYKESCPRPHRECSLLFLTGNRCDLANGAATAQAKTGSQSNRSSSGRAAKGEYQRICGELLRIDRSLHVVYSPLLHLTAALGQNPPSWSLRG